jgi:hypothetical protein
LIKAAFSSDELRFSLINFTVIMPISDTTQKYKEDYADFLDIGRQGGKNGPPDHFMPISADKEKALI